MRDEPEETVPTVYILTAYVNGAWDDTFFGYHYEGENFFYSKKEAEEYALEAILALKSADPNFDEDEFGWDIEEKEFEQDPKEETDD